MDQPRWQNCQTNEPCLWFVDFRSTFSCCLLGVTQADRRNPSPAPKSPSFSLKAVMTMSVRFYFSNYFIRNVIIAVEITWQFPLNHQRKACRFQCGESGVCSCGLSSFFCYCPTFHCFALDLTLDCHVQSVMYDCNKKATSKRARLVSFVSSRANRVLNVPCGVIFSMRWSPPCLVSCKQRFCTCII